MSQKKSADEVTEMLGPGRHFFDSSAPELELPAGLGQKRSWVFKLCSPEMLFAIGKKKKTLNT
jgi:hypothetical protein